jgi:hypothetical protein
LDHDCSGSSHGESQSIHLAVCENARWLALLQARFLGKNNTPKPGWAHVNSHEEHHPKATYYVRHREGSRTVWTTISAVLPTLPAGEEGGITASADGVWMVTDKHGTLVRVDPSTNSVRDRIHIPPGSFNPVFSDGAVWINGVETNVLTAVDAASGKVLASIPVGSKPRFLTAGAGSIGH